MATLDQLKSALRGTAAAIVPGRIGSPMTGIQYSDGFDIFTRDSAWLTYQDFIIPQLSRQLAPLLDSLTHVSVLEIGPGPKSVMGYLPDHQRNKITRYNAFEPIHLFVTRLETWLRGQSEASVPPLPGLQTPAIIHRAGFSKSGSKNVHQPNRSNNSTAQTHDNTKFDVVIFCHSMYGMHPKRDYIARALEMLKDGGMVVVFHRDSATMDLDGLVCSRTACFPTGVVSINDEDEELDRFTRFIAGYSPGSSVLAEWRQVCRSVGRKTKASGHLEFSAPDIMLAFNKHAASALPDLLANVPSEEKSMVRIKNRTARLRRSAAVVRPTEIKHVQYCVKWALKHELGLTVVGGSHSDHCIWPGIVAVDMSAFDSVHVLPPGVGVGRTNYPDTGSLIIAGAGSNTGDIIKKAMAEGLTVPLGSRPSVGTGLWLHGGIGHLARLHGLACDAILGALVVSAASGDVMCVGYVPGSHAPADAIRQKDDGDLLWATKGAGSNFGIVISVTFKPRQNPIYWTWNRVCPLGKSVVNARGMLRVYDREAKDLARSFSTDAYLYFDQGGLQLGESVYKVTSPTPDDAPAAINELQAEMINPWMVPRKNFEVKNAVDLFDTEMYMSAMHGGHAGGKTSAFKRCVFLRSVGDADVGEILVKALGSRPSPLCYFHLLHGGGAVSDVPPATTAFGCRDWTFACVVTGVWSRGQDDTETSRAVVRWVYDVVEKLLPLCTGVYAADLGPDPRDAVLAEKAFGPNRPRLARIKRTWDPNNVMAYSCPLPTNTAPMEPKLIILVTGESGAGKDYNAAIWTSIFTNKGYSAVVASISESIKRDYAQATGANLNLLLSDRAYKEQHRVALTTFFQERAREHPNLPRDQFLQLVYRHAEVDVLFITGMRDQAPVCEFSHRVPDSRLLEVRVTASPQTRRLRRGEGSEPPNVQTYKDTPLPYRPSLTFNNDDEAPGKEGPIKFANNHLLPLLDDKLKKLASMVRTTPNFPRPGINFRHILGIAQQPGGLSLCTSLLQQHFSGDWTKVTAIASCETGGYIFASPLAMQVNVPMIPIRAAGKLPPPTTVASTPAAEGGQKKEPEPTAKIELNLDALPLPGTDAHGSLAVVVVDDVLATGRTLCAVLQLLVKAARISVENISVLVVAEFPVHRGREFLRQQGFGRVRVQSLLVYGGA
ncbi:phosphoribosyl transferase domain protein [Podospora australis]|uniref:Phosphoribosyl transferase domain protein n=1 Tax=Podospora australis TaxID=1536484 RepID=A0AAN7AEI2_9PEZI|nr:phosphoribosyl transferase domain protein [Podospora australis]